MMTQSVKSIAVVAAVTAMVALLAFSAANIEGKVGSGGWEQEFGIAQCKLQTTGKNPYFVMEPGYQLVLEGREGTTNLKLQITVLDETLEVDGVPTRVVEEREWKDGKLYEVARNFFAMCEATKDVFYFGEDVDFYENDVIVKHDGSWRAGNGNKAGLYMAGKPTVRRRYYQEIAPKVAMDRAEIISLNATCKTPVGTFGKCLKIKEGSALELAAKEYKYYAPQIGFVGDDNLRLVKYGFISQQ